MSTRYATAPAAPGSLGADVEPQALLAYLQALGEWRDRRRQELDELDQASLHAPDRDALTGDVLLSMALWKAVAERHDLLLATWDSGRVMAPERRRLTTLIWGRLDDGDSALAVSLPEACRLSDSLAGSLRSRLRLEGTEPDVDNRVREVRATIARIYDQIALVPSGARAGVEQVYDALDARAKDVAERAARGADVGGMLPALELDAATAERDLIVGAARRTEAKEGAARAAARLAQLDATAHAVTELAARAVAEVTPAPRLAVPDPGVLGAPPTEPDALAAFTQRLDLVGQALEQARATYAAALEERDDLLAEADRPAPELEGDLANDLHTLADRIAQVRTQRPLPVRRLAALVGARAAYVAAAAPQRRTP